MSSLITKKARVTIVLALTLVVALAAEGVVAYEKEVKSLSSAMAERIARAGKKTIAVVDFSDLQGNVTELGRFLAEEVSVALSASAQGFEVVDRAHLKTLLREHQLQMSDIVDPKTVTKLGSIAGVQALITGTITPFGDNVRLSVKMLDAATARVIGASSTDIAKTKAIEELLARGVTSSTAPADAPLSGTTPAPALGTAKYQEFPKFRVEVEGLQVDANNGITVFVAYVNKTQEELQIMLGSPRERTFVLDNAGNRYTFGSSSGLSGSFESSYPTRLWYGQPMPLSPGGRITASFGFSPPRSVARPAAPPARPPTPSGTREKQGNLFSFSSEQGLVKPKAGGAFGQDMGAVALFNISIRNIEPR